MNKNGLKQVTKLWDRIDVLFNKIGGIVKKKRENICHPPATFLIRFYITFNLIIKLTCCVIQILQKNSIIVKCDNINFSKPSSGLSAKLMLSHDDS